MIPDIQFIQSTARYEEGLYDHFLLLINIENNYFQYIGDFLIISHILMGGIALIVGNWIAFLKKGNLFHKQLGQIYVLSMLGVFITAFFRSIQIGNEFLFAIGFFSLSLTLSAFYSIQIQATSNHWKQKFVSWGSICTGSFLIITAFWSPLDGAAPFNLIPLVFGLISLWMGVSDLRRIKRPFVYSENLSAHISRMGGSLISAWTAFIVVNVTFVPPLISWLAPTLIGTIVISMAIQKYTGQKNV